MPSIRIAPSQQTRLSLLTQAAQHDMSCACGPNEQRKRGPDGLWIYPAALPSGRRVPMLKVLQASGCERGCIYCVERLGGRSHPLVLSPDELASSFAELHRQRRVAGLFLSSAIRGGAVATMDRMLATAERVRQRHHFRGYLHLKIIPGSRPDQVERAMELATRVSVNMEAPTAGHLRQIAPSKQYDHQILAHMRQVARAQEAGRFTRAGQTTQLVVGASGESDRQIAMTTDWMYRDLRMARIYYSSLQPVPGTAVEGFPSVPFMREHRLYQVDFLFRRYGFKLDEIVFDERGALPLDVDPKSAWAKSHPERFPIEVNTAPLGDLLRIPGVGPLSAQRIVDARVRGKLRTLEALRAQGVSCRAASPFVLLDGRPAERQLSFALGA